MSKKKPEDSIELLRDANVEQLAHLSHYFYVRKTQGLAAALEYANKIIEEHAGSNKKPHLTVVK